MAVGGLDVVGRLRAGAALLAAALQVGLADAAVALATGYARQRTQFGRLIGSFQALKHLLADAQVQVEVARAAVQAAGVEIDDDSPGTATRPGPTGPSTLPASWPRGPPTAPPGHAQVHGGMGFTWELDAHLYLKRALVLDVGIGSPDEAVESLAGAL